MRICVVGGERHLRRPATRHGASPSSFFEFVQHVVQRLEALGPRALVVLDPVVDGLQRAAVEPVQPLPARRRARRPRPPRAAPAGAWTPAAAPARARATRSLTGRSPPARRSRICRRRGSATALNASAVVAARAMVSELHADIGIRQVARTVAAAARLRRLGRGVGERRERRAAELGRGPTSTLWSLYEPNRRVEGLEGSSDRRLGCSPPRPVSSARSPYPAGQTPDPALMGRSAAELAFARLDGDDRPFQRMTIPTELIVRGSGERTP